MTNRADRRRAAATKPDTGKLAQMGRLAMRHEGENWNGYWAVPDTMSGALFLGSIKMAFVTTPERREAFMSLLRDGVSDLIEEQYGYRPEWPGAVAAPDHERTRQ